MGNLRDNRLSLKEEVKKEEKKGEGVREKMEEGGLVEKKKVLKEGNEINEEEVGNKVKDMDKKKKEEKKEVELVEEQGSEWFPDRSTTTATLFWIC